MTLKDVLKSFWRRTNLRQVDIERIKRDAERVAFSEMWTPDDPEERAAFIERVRKRWDEK